MSIPVTRMMNCLKLKTVSFDFKGLAQNVKTDRRNGDLTEKKHSRQVLSLPRNINELVSSQLEKERSKSNKCEEARERRPDSLCLLKLANGDCHGEVKFPSPEATNREVREALEKMKTSFRMSAAQRRSLSAPSEHLFGRTKKKPKTRFPLLAPTPCHATTRTSCEDKLMVVGRKFTEAPQKVQRGEEAAEKPKEVRESFIEDGQNGEDFVLRIGLHDNCISFHDDHKLGHVHSNGSRDFPSDVSKCFKPLYGESSISFDAYLRSRFGRSVFISRDDPADPLDKTKRSSVDWAPLIVKKQDLSERRTGGEMQKYYNGGTSNR